MRICKEHWQMCRDAIDELGMGHLGAKSGKVALDNIVDELQTGETPPFDPLMSMNNHWWSEALQSGGLYLMGQPEDGSNEGHYCPVCEFSKHQKGFDARSTIHNIASQMQAYCYDEGIIPRPS